MRTLLFIFLAFTIRGQSIGFLEDDKFQHDQAGMVISGLAGSSAYFFGLRPFASCAIGFGAAVMAGITKELYDKYSGTEVPDFWDGVATGFGGLRMALCLRIGIHENEKKLYLRQHVFD